MFAACGLQNGRLISVLLTSAVALFLAGAATLDSGGVFSNVVVLQDLTICGTRVVALRDYTNATAEFAVRVVQEKPLNSQVKIVRAVFNANAYEVTVADRGSCVIAVGTDRQGPRELSLRQGIWF